MPTIEESWLPMAQTLGYKDEKEMLSALYITERFSFKEIGKILGVAQWSVRRRIYQYGIAVRSRGGPNRLGKRKLIDVSDEELTSLSYKELAEKYKANVSSVYAERKLRKLCNSVQ